jgi:NAD(P)-dependent dehydrogenase (short-subunit alcohol dehydrogenase family)
VRIKTDRVNAEIRGAFMDLNLDKKVSVVTGAGGSICGKIAEALARENVRVAIWDIDCKAAEKKAEEISANGLNATAIACDVLDKNSVQNALKKTISIYDTVDILINGAGGTRPDATTSPENEFFDIKPENLDTVMKLNYMSTVIPSQAAGRVFAKKKSGVILNISSVAGISPLTRSIAYSNGKAATINFTRWLAVHMAQNYSPEIRVNAMAPGFILTEQNRFLLIEKDTGEMTERGKKILNFVPMARLGNPAEVTGCALWLVSDQASFVTGSVVPVDGGFTAYSGV